MLARAFSLLGNDKQDKTLIQISFLKKQLAFLRKNIEKNNFIPLNTFI